MGGVPHRAGGLGVDRTEIRIGRTVDHDFVQSYAIVGEGV